MALCYKVFWGFRFRVLVLYRLLGVLGLGFWRAFFLLSGFFSGFGFRALGWISEVLKVFFLN